MPITKRFVRLPSGGTGFEQLLDPSQVPTPVGEYVLEECKPGERSTCRTACLDQDALKPRDRGPGPYSWFSVAQIRTQ